MKTIGFVFSAGNEKRFDGAKPKALQDIHGETLLKHNVDILRDYCDDVIVVTNHINEPLFSGYNHIPIKSGQGCGDAVLKAMKLYDVGYDRVIIQWGDCYLFDDVIKKAIEPQNSCYDLVIPCKYERKPYVRLSFNNNRIKVEFSKYGEVKGNGGYHDFGVFCGKFYKILSYLDEFATCHKCGGTYKHKHGDELQFLDVVNETRISTQLLLIDDVNPISFNTKKELNKINEGI